MAMQDETIRYIPTAVDGSAAREFSDYEDFDYGTSAPELPRHCKKTRQEAYRRENVRFRIEPMSVIGVLIAATLAVLALLASVSLTAITAETVQLEQKLEEMQDQERMLQIKYENTFRLTEIEEYATRTLGMVRLQDSQQNRLEQTADDHAEILHGEESAALQTVLREAGSLWTAIQAYFGR